MQQKPTLVNVIAWTTLASGIVNVFWSVVAFSHPIGWICAPVSILPLILGVCEIIYAAKLLGNAQQPVKPSTNIAVFEIAAVLYGNVFAMVVGILSLVFYNDQIVKEYFAQLNGTALVAPVMPVPPAPPMESIEPEPPENPDLPNPS